MFLQKKSIPILLTIVVLLTLGAWGCDAVGELPGGGEGGVTIPEDPGAPEPEPTQAPPEPEPTQAPPEPAPTNPPDPVQPPDSGGSQPSQNDDLITILLVIIVIGIVLGAIVFIISLLSRPREKTTETAAAPPPVSPPTQQTPISEPITENTHLKNASPAVTDLYKRFVDLVKSYGPVSIVPTETRIDFQARSIFASVQFRLENLELQLVLPRIVQDLKIIRVDTIGTEKYSHLIMIDLLDDYDAAFNTWLQEAYILAS